MITDQLFGANFRKEWRPVAPKGLSQENTWTTFSESELARERAQYPWMRFQYRLVSDWVNEEEEK